MAVPSQSYCLVSFVGSSVRENTGSRFTKIVISRGNAMLDCYRETCRRLGLCEVYIVSVLSPQNN